MRVAVFHPGTQHSYETALGFQRAGELAWYATEIFYDPLRFPYRLIRLLPRALQDKATAEFRRRYNPHLDPALVRTFGIWEWIERASMRVGLRRVEHYANEWGNRRFGSRVGAMAVRDGVECVWGCDTSSRNAFRIAKAHGIRCVLEQTIGHPRAWNRILTDEREQMPADFDSYPRPYPEADLARVDEEIALADHVCCGSAFVKSTMSEWGVPGLKVSVIPYGVRAKNFTPADAPRTDAGLRLLFVGHFGMRKGAWYLLQAMARLKHLRGLTLTMIGKQTVGARYLAPVASMIQTLAHTPRAQMPAIYHAADVLVLPSLFEGSAGATYEALASGLPVITTPNTGSIVRDGVDGLIVPARDVEALAERIEQLYGDVRLRHAMATQARERALQFPWERYQQACVRVADLVIGGRGSAGGRL
jgi:glycosyltransferase involved in cell wall biosynthesis